jgi:hypothetical protein
MKTNIQLMFIENFIMDWMNNKINMFAKNAKGSLKIKYGI